jgi:hypothetical protein
MAGEQGPVEVHLPDGGRVIVTGSIEAVLHAVVHATGTEADVEDAIRQEAEEQGLSCTASNGGPRVLVVTGRGSRG